MSHMAIRLTQEAEWVLMKAVQAWAYCWGVAVGGTEAYISWCSAVKVPPVMVVVVASRNLSSLRTTTGVGSKKTRKAEYFPFFAENDSLAQHLKPVVLSTGWSSN